MYCHMTQNPEDFYSRYLLEDFYGCYLPENNKLPNDSRMTTHIQHTYSTGTPPDGQERKKTSVKTDHIHSNVEDGGDGLGVEDKSKPMKTKGKGHQHQKKNNKTQW